MLEDFEWALDFPRMVPVVIVVRRNCHDDVGCFGGLEKAAKVCDYVVLGHTLSHDRPGKALRAHEIDLRVDHDQGRTRSVQLHVALFKGRIWWIGIGIIGGRLRSSAADSSERGRRRDPGDGT